jgi:trehalose 6-phosphate phosphatase
VSFAAPLHPDAVIEQLAANPSAAGLFVDFDGTLAPIVEEPSAAAMPRDLGPVLAVLADRLALVAVVSGRPAAFLAQQVGVSGVRLLGLYGLQEWVDGDARPRPEAETWQGTVDLAKDSLAAAMVGTPGVLLEDKGLAVAVHWRNARNRKRAGELVELAALAVAEQTGLAREPGKFVEELRPPIDWDKGASVRSLTAELGLATVVYAGDDRGDLAAFEVVREMGGFALAVDAGAETHPDVLAGADAVLDGTEAFAAWLRRLAERLGSAA